MMSTERRGPVVVIGMGRSGTSYVASLLDAAGYGLGAELKPADAANEAGYYEDLEVTHMHERRLAELGLDLGTVSERFPLPATPAVADEVRSYVTHRESAGGPWGVKPPGALFFWPAWREALPRSTVLLLPFPHPDGVVDSYVAGGDTRERAEALWLQLNRLALSAIDSGPFEGVVLNFDRPERVSRRLSAVLGVEVPDTYRPELRHHRGSVAPSGELGVVYRELLRRAAF
jgi:hypothetical protein